MASEGGAIWAGLNSLLGTAALVVAAVSVALARRKRALVEEDDARSARRLREEGSAVETYRLIVSDLRAQIQAMRQQLEHTGEIQNQMGRTEEALVNTIGALQVWSDAVTTWAVAIRGVVATRAGIPESSIPPPPPRLNGGEEAKPEVK